jgi:hypothetical protein
MASDESRVIENEIKIAMAADAMAAEDVESVQRRANAPEPSFQVVVAE